MGSSSWLARAIFTVAVHVLGMMTSSQVMLDNQLFYCNATANVTSGCCLQCDYNAYCNNTCPQGQLILNFTESLPTCVFTNASDSNTTSSEEKSRDFVVVCVTSCPDGYYQDGERCKKCDDVCVTCTGPGINDTTCTCPLRRDDKCVQKCDKGFYNDNGNCEKCDDACKSCNASGSRVDTCDCKFEFNGTCYESCHSNITECPDKNEEANTALIIGLASGGAVILIIIVVVIVVVCCRCRKRKTKSRMSTIIENRGVNKDEEEEMGIQLPRQVRGKKPGKYENVQVLGSAVSNQAQDTQDKKTRYAKDPTLQRGVTLGDQPKDQPDRSSALYANAEAIKLDRNLAKGERMDTKLNRGVFNKLKKSIIGRKTKKDAAKSGTTNPVFNDDVTSSSGDAYCDMSGLKAEPEQEQEEYVQLDPKGDNEPQDDYENFGNVGGAEPLDDYENFGNTSKTKLQDDEPQDDYENFNGNHTEDEPQDEYENFQSNSNVNAVDDEPQEEYENFDPASAVARAITSRRKKEMDKDEVEESPYVNVSQFQKKS